MSLVSKNEFFSELNEEDKKKFEILFDNSSKIEEWKKSFKEFIKLQKEKDTINLVGIVFLENYNITEENDFIFQIFKKFNILKKDQNPKNKKKETYDIIKKKLDFSNAKFKGIEFIRITFEQEAVFEGAIFEGNSNFRECNFKERANFEGVKFKKEVVFKESVFNKETQFYRAYFNEYSNFEKAEFKEYCDFENVIANGYFYFHEVKIDKINLKGSYFAKANFLGLTNIIGYIIKKDNFENKETVRILKDIFEKENNFSESNIYFPIEQEFFIELLKDKTTSFPNKTLNLISLYFHKFISNFGTDWFRVLLVMMLFGFSVGIIYYIFYYHKCFIYPHLNKDNFLLLIFFEYSIVSLYLAWVFKEEDGKKIFLGFFVIFLILIIISFLKTSASISEVSNYVIQLINPLNMFSSDFYFNGYYKHINFFEKYALFGVAVKTITIVLIYQFIIAFRNSTRRK